MSNEVIRDELGEELGEGLPDGTYRCTTTAKLIKSKKPSRKVPYLNGDQREAVYFTITYVISDPDSKYFGADDIKDFFELFPDLNRENLQDLDPEERAEVRKQIGNRTRRFRQLGLPEEKVHAYTEGDLSNIDVLVTVKTSISRTDQTTRFLNIQEIKPAAMVNDTALEI